MLCINVTLLPGKRVHRPLIGATHLKCSICLKQTKPSPSGGKRKKNVTSLSWLSQKSGLCSKVFRPEFLAILSQMALVMQLAQSEVAHGLVDKDKALPSNLVVKI